MERASSSQSLKLAVQPPHQPVSLFCLLRVFIGVLSEVCSLHLEKELFWGGQQRPELMYCVRP